LINHFSPKIEGGKIALRSSQLRKELTDQHITCREAASLPAIRNLKLPIYEKDGNTFIAGTCAVCRLVLIELNLFITYMLTSSLVKILSNGISSNKFLQFQGTYSQATE